MKLWSLFLLWSNLVCPRCCWSPLWPIWSPAPPLFDGQQPAQLSVCANTPDATATSTPGCWMCCSVWHTKSYSYIVADTHLQVHTLTQILMDINMYTLCLADAHRWHTFVNMHCFRYINTYYIQLIQHRFVCTIEIESVEAVWAFTSQQIRVSLGGSSFHGKSCTCSTHVTVFTEQFF